MKSKDIYKVMTDKMLALIEAGTIPWRKTWKSLDMPRNLVTNKPYRGANLFWLALLGGDYKTPYWLTYRQAKSLGGHVKKGEKGTPVLFWKPFETEKEEDDGSTTKRRHLMVRKYTVFNYDQTEGVRMPKGRMEALATPGGKAATDEEALAEAVKVFTTYTDREKIKVGNGGDRAFYAPKTDEIRLPQRGAFETGEAYAATAFHEATHSTGAKSRLNRPGIAEFDFFGSHQYSEEELVAEFGATFLCSLTGVEREEQVENSAAYLRHWAAKLKEDPKILVMAAQRAQKAVDFIMGVKPGKADYDGKEKDS